MKKSLLLQEPNHENKKKTKTKKNFTIDPEKSRS